MNSERHAPLPSRCGWAGISLATEEIVVRRALASFPKIPKTVFQSKSLRGTQPDLHIPDRGGGGLPRGGSTIGSIKQSLDGLGGSRKCLVFRDLLRAVVPWPGDDKGLRYRFQKFSSRNLAKGL